MASIQKSNYTMVSENWSFAETFRFEEVVYLLCGYEPAVGIDHEIRRKLLPASIPGEELLMSSMRSGDLLLAALGEPLWALGPVAQFKAQPYHPGHIVTRSRLQNLVAAKWPGKQLKWLFPDGVKHKPPAKKGCGNPGRRSMMSEAKDKMRQRHSAGKMARTLKAESEALEKLMTIEWSGRRDADRPSSPPKASGIRNQLRGIYNELKATPPDIQNGGTPS